MVGTADGVFVVLHHQQGVAAGLERFEGVEQQPVVARVQADGGLVEDVADATQVGAELGGEADALRLAARQGGRGTVQRQVAKTDLVQEVEAAADFTDQIAGDPGLALGEHQPGEERRHPLDGPRRQLVDAELAKAHRRATGLRRARHRPGRPPRRSARSRRDRAHRGPRPCH